MDRFERFLASNVYVLTSEGRLMNLLVPDQISILMQRAEAHAVLATEAAAIAFELVGQRHLAEAALIRAPSRNHRIRQLEILANIGALEAGSDRRQPSRA